MDAASHTRSIWMDTVDMPEFPSLTADATADVCVIGAGIAGMTTALLMLQAGRSVIVIDAKGVGGGETGRTTAHWFNPDERYFQIEKRFGHERQPRRAIPSPRHRSGGGDHTLGRNSL